VIEFLLNFK